jgi:hypothetical protein
MPRIELGVSGNFEAATPSDTTNLNSPTRRLYLGSGGNLNVRPTDAPTSDVLLSNLPSGWVDLSVVRVSETGTTASNIVVVY